MSAILRNFIVPAITLLLVSSCSKDHDDMRREFSGINESRRVNYLNFLEEGSSNEEWLEAFKPFCADKDWPIKKCQEEIADFKNKHYGSIREKREEEEKKVESERLKRISNGYEKDYRSESFEHLMNYRYLSDSNDTIAENFKKHNYLVNKDQCKFKGEKDGAVEVISGIVCNVQNKKYSWSTFGVDPQDFKDPNLKKETVIWIPFDNDNSAVEAQFEEITRVKWRDYLFTSKSEQIKTIAETEHYLKNVDTLFKKIIEEYEKKSIKFTSPEIDFRETGLNKTITMPGKGVSLTYQVDASKLADSPREEIWLSVDANNSVRNGLEDKLRILAFEIYKDEQHSNQVAKLVMDKIKKELPLSWGGESKNDYLNNCSEKWKNEINLFKVKEKLLGFINVKLYLPCSADSNSEKRQSLIITFSNR